MGSTKLGKLTLAQLQLLLRLAVRVLVVIDERGQVRNQGSRFAKIRTQPLEPGGIIRHQNVPPPLSSARW